MSKITILYFGQTLVNFNTFKQELEFYNADDAYFILNGFMHVCWSTNSFRDKEP